MEIKYKRVLLKVSGEALEDEKNHTIFSREKMFGIAQQVKILTDKKVQVCLVVGAGNIWRGKLASSLNIDPAAADDMGMLGTVINGLGLKGVLENEGLKAHVFSSVPLPKFCDYYTQRDALRALEQGEVCIFVGGTGNPFFTTDSCAALRALETSCDVILMAKNGVDGVYTADPKKDKNAKLLKSLTYHDILSKNLKVMDNTAAGLLEESQIQIRVFEMKPENFLKVITGDPMGTLITSGKGFTKQK